MEKCFRKAVSLYAVVPIHGRHAYGGHTKRLEFIRNPKPVRVFKSDNIYGLWGKTMVGKPEGHSPEYWRDMAREARTVADRLATEATRRQMLAAAENYERLADQSEEERAD